MAATSSLALRAVTSGPLPRKTGRREVVSVRTTRGDGKGEKEVEWTVYILKSSEKGLYYKGSTEDFGKRLAEHNTGRVASTKHARPWVEHYTEKFETKTDALKRERYFKTRSGYRWLKQRGII